MFYKEEISKDKILKAMSKGEGDQNILARNCDTDLEFSICRDWLLNNGYIGFKDYPYMTLTPYGQYFVNNQNKFWVKAFIKHLTWVLGAIVALTTLYYTIQGYNETKRQGRLQKAAQESVTPK